MCSEYGKIYLSEHLEPNVSLVYNASYWGKLDGF